MTTHIDLSDYKVVLKRINNHPPRWVWDLHRGDVSLAKNICRKVFASERAAKKAGYKELAKILGLPFNIVQHELERDNDPATSPAVI